MRITIDDVRKAGFCVSGARALFEANGVPFSTFVQEGMEADEFLERGDEFARIVVAKKEATDGRG